MVSDHIAQKLVWPDAKRALGSIEVQRVFPQYFKNIPEVFYMFGHHFTLYHHIIYIDFNILAQLWLKHPSHHSLIGRPCILKTKRYQGWQKLSSLNHLRPVVFDSIPERHLENSFEYGLQWHLPTGLSETWGKGLFDKPYLNLRSPHTLAISHFSSSLP